MSTPDDTTVPTPEVLSALRDLAAEVHDDVERYAFDRAWLVAGGPLLSVANRLGWPAADVFLSFVLAVRALAHVNRGGVRDLPTAMSNYERQRAIIGKWLDPAPVPE